MPLRFFGWLCAVLTREARRKPRNESAIAETVLGALIFCGCALFAVVFWTEAVIALVFLAAFVAFIRWANRSEKTKAVAACIIIFGLIAFFVTVAIVAHATHYR